MSLEIIRSKLDPMYNDHYKDVNAFINDVRLIFRNVYLFYRVSIAMFHRLKSTSLIRHISGRHYRKTQRSMLAYAIWMNFSNSNWENGCHSTAGQVIIQQIWPISSKSLIFTLERAPKGFVPMKMYQ